MLLRIHPALALVMVTEFPANHVNLPGDLVCFYLAMPFGWNGAPSHFAVFGGAIAGAHVRCGLHQPVTLMRHSFRSMMYVDDGIFIEIAAPERMLATTLCWERLTKGALGPTAINGDKLGTEGTWETQQILLGFAISLELLTISLHGDKIAGASGLFVRFRV